MLLRFIGGFFEGKVADSNMVYALGILCSIFGYGQGFINFMVYGFVNLSIRKVIFEYMACWKNYICFCCSSKEETYLDNTDGTEEKEK